ncbi:Na/Pi cotransporter family protein [Flavobacterium sp. C4GT6]|uniref:Na/Pi cotransporter family protein n=1 Tax=Flavobacterium sp. C4GT6 TaxID=3103818 RepID=UPI002ED09CF6
MEELNWLKILISVIAAIGLFTHSLEGFSDTLKSEANSKIKSLLTTLSHSKIKAFLLGFVGTALIQSSSAVISIVVSFVDSGVLLFESSLPILLGSNLGTTVTAWLVSFQMEALGIILLALGFVMGYFPERIKLYSKPVFYMGLILFSLELISMNLTPIKDSPDLVDFLGYASNPFIGILYGILITAICQSSSVTVGLTIILCSQNILGLDSAIGIIVGSNIGTTTTAFIASLKLGKVAKQTALANLAFNAIGVVIYLPFYKLFENLILSISSNITYQAALAHLIFNLIIAIVLLPVCHQFASLFKPKGEMLP